MSQPGLDHFESQMLVSTLSQPSRTHLVSTGINPYQPRINRYQPRIDLVSTTYQPVSTGSNLVSTSYQPVSTRINRVSTTSQPSPPWLRNYHVSTTPKAIETLYQPSLNHVSTGSQDYFGGLDQGSRGAAFTTTVCHVIRWFLTPLFPSSHFRSTLQNCGPALEITSHKNSRSGRVQNT